MIRRKIISLLQPWLREEPNLDLKLGFIQSYAVARNLRFNCSVLNQRLDVPPNLFFEDVTAEQISIRFSSWSAPAFTIEVHGVSIKLSLEKLDEDASLKRSRKPKDDCSEILKKKLSVLDPEGAALHYFLGRILETIPPKHDVKASVLNHIFKHCHLDMHDIQVRVQCQAMNDLYVCFGEIKDFSARSKDTSHGCLLKGLLSALFLPSNQSSYVLNGIGCTIGLNVKDCPDRALLTFDLLTQIKLLNLKPVKLSLRVPEMSFSFSPDDLAICLAFEKLSSYSSKKCRSGRQLWRLAAKKMIHASLFRKMISGFSQWFLYVKAYESLLLLIGYSVDQLLKRFIYEVSRKESICSFAKHQWEAISEIEKDLPPEGIALARRVARCRAAVNVKNANGDQGPSFGVPFSHSSRFLSLLVNLWKLVLQILLSIPNILLRKIDSKFGRKIFESHFQSFSFAIYFGKVKMNVLQLSEIPYSLNEVLQSQIGLTYSDFHSFCLLTDGLSLIYEGNILKQHMVLSCGEIKVKSSCFMGPPVLVISPTDFVGSVEENHNGRIEDPNLDSVMWVEPAKWCYRSESKPIHVGSSFSPLLGNILGDMWLNWKRLHKDFDNGEIEYSKDPCIHCEIAYSVMDADSTDPDPVSGYWKCNLNFGKINIVLSHASIFSVFVLFGSLKHALRGTKESCGTRVPPCAGESVENHHGSVYMHRARGLILSLIRRLPEKHVQLGMLFSGLCIQFSLGKGFNDGKKGADNSQENSCITCDLHSIKAVVCPTSSFDIASLKECLGFDDAELDAIRVGPQVIEIPKCDNEMYVSRGRISLSSYVCLYGMDAYMGNATEEQQLQLLALKPMLISLSSLREYIFSLSTRIVAFSAALSIISTGFSALSYIDELCVIFQVIGRLSSAISFLFSSFESLSFTTAESLGLAMLIKEPQKEQPIVVLVTSSILFSVNGIFRLKSIDLVFHKSRAGDNNGSGMGSTGFLNVSKLAENILPNYGILVSLQQTALELSCEEGKIAILTDLSGLELNLFEYQNQEGKMDYIKNLMLRDVNCLYEMSLSSCIFSVYLGDPQDTLGSGSVNKTLGHSDCNDSAPSMVETSHSTTKSKRSNVNCDGLDPFGRKMRFSSNAFVQSLSHWLLVNVSIGSIFIGECTMKKVLVGAEHSNKLQSQISVGGDFKVIFWEIKGGVIIVNAIALAVCSHNLVSYFHCVSHLMCMHLYEGHPWTRAQDAHRSQVADDAQQTHRSCQQTKKHFPDAFSLDLSGISLLFVLQNESGGIQEFVFEVDVNVNSELENLGRKCIFDISRLAIVSQIIDGRVGDESVIPHFSPATFEASSSFIPSEASSSKAQCLDEISMVHDASSSSKPVALKKLDRFKSEESHLSYQNQLLKHLRVYLSLDSAEHDPQLPEVAFFGTGSVTGFDMVISLSEVEMILTVLSSLSALFNKETTADLQQTHWPTGQGFDINVEALVPNGAIVAIQDVDQHMYLTVEGGESNCSVGGVLHYSLVGEKALFRVKYRNERRRKSTVVWFSLISLHARNNMGEHLRLNYRQGSGFVDISSSNDGVSALWKALPCEHDDSMDDMDLGPYNQLINKTFHLINNKNDLSVAFLDGVVEFVRKPGHPFKFKVFCDLFLARDVVHSDSNRVLASGSSQELIEERSIGGQGGKLPQIDIRVEKISVTIVHKLPDTKDLFPLLRGFIGNTQFILQTLPIKSRVIVTTSATLDYFDARICIWKELLCPVDLYFFYRKTRLKQNADICSHGVPVNIYFRTGVLDVYLTEISLDILLFVIGKLDLSGPYAVRNLMIMSNSCKVDNRSGLNLICDFHDKQRVVVAKRQSTSILLRRHLDVENQDSEAIPSVSIQLSDLDFLATSSMNLFLLDTRIIAWRTRIVTHEDPKTLPGPFLVVEIARSNEDGLSIVVSPLMRIHNATGCCLELRFQRPQAKEDEFACLFLKPGECIDDTMATFDATKSSGGVKKVLMSLSVGNFFFSFRPDLTEDLHDSKTSLSAEWSEFLSGGKAVRLSGLFDKLSYRVRMALPAEPVRCSFSTTMCILKDKDSSASDMHFLIQTISRDVPVTPPEKLKDDYHHESSPIAIHEQKEIYLLPTVRVTNLMHFEINVFLSETDQSVPIACNSFGKQAKISCGSAADFFSNPATIYFTFTLIAPNLTSKPVNSSDWVKMLQKKKTSVQHLDINLDFGGGNYFATLRLHRGDKGVLEAAVFTSYTLTNGTEFPIYIITTNKKYISRTELEKLKFEIPSDLGMFLPPNSTISWLLKSKKVQLKSLEGHTSETLLDLDAFSGLTEMSLIKEDESGIKSIMKLGLSAEFSSTKPLFPSQTVTLVPRYVVHNTSEENVVIRQCYAQDDLSGMIAVKSKQQITLQLQEGFSKSREFSLFENFIRKHRSSNDDSLLYIQFRIRESELSWSGPVCIASLGHFFLKFRKQPNQATDIDHSITEFASVHLVEKGSTLILHFYKPPDGSTPYRIENCLYDLSITFYQKGSSETEVLGSSSNVSFVWDDYTLPHKLVVRINDSLLLREIKLDKVQSWKPFYKPRQRGVLGHYLPMQKKPEDLKNSFDGLHGIEVSKIGYEIYADGPTRVLRISEISDKFKKDRVFNSSGKTRLRITRFAVHLLEQSKDGGKNPAYYYTPTVAAKFENLNLDKIFSDQKIYTWMFVQSLNFELKWVGAPFASMLRRHQLDYSNSNDCVLKVVFSVLSTSSNVKQVTYCSMFIQPMDLNLDEETMMRIVPFWRKSLSNSQSQWYYFDHFEIHPVKIIANFVPGELDSSYTSAQEALRSLLHSVVKVPAIKNMVVELNGILITHALITLRELSFKCAQHYSWYAMRAIYIAKGSPLLPPDFVSIFDDLSSSSLDVFFDPSRVLTSLPGFTLGTFKFIRKCISGKGFSGRKRYFGDLGNTLRTAGSNVLYTAVTEISDSILKGAERSGFNGLLSGFHQGILKLAMEPSLLGTALMEGGPDRKIQLDRSPGIDELYIEGYLQAMLDTIYRQEYLRVRVIDNQVILKNLPPNNSLIDEIINRVKGFLGSKALLKGDASTYSHSLRHLRGESEWKLGPTVLTLCEHLFVSFTIRTMRKHANQYISRIKWKEGWKGDNQEVERANSSEENKKIKFIWRWGIGKFVFSGILAYIDGRLCRCIPNPIARRIVSGFVLSFLDKNDDS